VAKLAEVVVPSGGQATIDFPSISQAYKHLVVVIVGRADAAQTAQAGYLQFNGDTSAAYDRESLFTQGNAGAPINYDAFAQAQQESFYLPAANAPAGESGSYAIEIPLYAGTTFNKTYNSRGQHIRAQSTGQYPIGIFAGSWRSTAAINRVTLGLSAGNVAAGTVATLYGVDGPGSTAVTIPAPVTSKLAADVALTTTNTYYDGPSVTLPAGTWVLFATLTIGTGGATTASAKIWDGTTVYASQEGTQGYAGTLPVALTPVSPPITLTATTTLKVSVAVGTAGCALRTTMDQNPAGANATQLTAIPIPTSLNVLAPSGGISSAYRAYATATASVSDASMAAAVDSLSVTFTLTAAADVRITADLITTRPTGQTGYTLYDSGTKIAPSSAVPGSARWLSKTPPTADNNRQDAHFSTIIRLAAGAHTIQVYHEASATVDTVTFYDRSLSCDVLA